MGGDQLSVRSVPDAVSIRLWGLSGTPEDVRKIIKIFRVVAHANSSSEIREHEPHRDNRVSTPLSS